MVKKSLLIYFVLILVFVSSMMFVSASVCGDGVIDEGEICDDGNIEDYDGCDSTCQNPCTDTEEGEDPYIKGTACAFRGNCYTDRCDGYDAITDYHCDFERFFPDRVYMVKLFCGPGEGCLEGICVLFCGNDVVDEGEECDGNSNSESCTDSNQYEGTKSCLDDCTWECITTESCGDGIVNGNEECDGNNESCTDSNGYSGTRSCLSSCIWDSCISIESCGDGIVNGNEQCDDNNILSGDGCSSTCVQENTIPPNNDIGSGSSSGGGGSSGGSSSGGSSIGATFEGGGTFEEGESSIEEEIREGERIVKETRRFEDENGNNVEIKSKVITKTDGSSIREEERIFTDQSGNEIQIKIRSEIKIDGTVITNETRRFVNKAGDLVEIKFEIETKGGDIKIKREIIVEGKGVQSRLEIFEIFEDGEVKLKAPLSNGGEQEIDIMPDEVSEIASEKLGIYNFSIELKEVGSGEDLRIVYLAQGDSPGKLLGLFDVNLNVEVQIDPETGEVIKYDKPWWAFLVSELEEVVPEEIINETDETEIIVDLNETVVFNDTSVNDIVMNNTANETFVINMSNSS